VKNFYMRL